MCPRPVLWCECDDVGFRQVNGPERLEVLEMLISRGPVQPDGRGLNGGQQRAGTAAGAVGLVG